MKKLLCFAVAVFLILPLTSDADSAVSRLEEKQFPLIMFAVPQSDAAFSQMKEMGIDYVHVYGMSVGPLDQARLKSIRSYLDLAQKHGLKVMFDLDGSRRIRQEDKKLALEETRLLTQEFKDHPALGFWYLYDEPELSKGSSPEVLKQFYNLLKQETPNIPVAVCTATALEARSGLDYKWSSFLETYDIHIFDTYPVKGQVFPQAKLTTVTEFNKKALALGKPVFPALQAFNYFTIDRYVKNAEEAGQSAANWRAPNRQELRFWNFSTLIQGARGMSYWSYARAATVPKANPAWVSGTLKPAVLEFREFTDIVHPASEKEAIETGTGDLFFAKWVRGDKSYFALVNGKGEAQNVTNSKVLDALSGKTLRPWKFTRPDAATSLNGQITKVDLQPWEVLIWVK
jgi:hypothetical protein